MTNNIQRNSLYAGASFLTGACLTYSGYTRAGLALMAGGTLVLGHQHFDRLSRTYKAYQSQQSHLGALAAAIKSFCSEGSAKKLDPKKNWRDFAPALQMVVKNIKTGDRAKLKAACDLLEISYKSYPQNIRDQLAESYKTLQRCKAQINGNSSIQKLGSTLDLSGPGFRCTLAKGDIIDVAKAHRTEAIMYGANEHLTSGGATAGRIFDTAGPRLLEATKAGLLKQNLSEIPTGKSVVTPCFDLSRNEVIVNGKVVGTQPSGITHVIHTVGPRREKYGNDTDANASLRNAIVGSLKAAMAAKVRSLTLIPLSSFNFGFKIDDSVRITLEVINEFRLKHPKAFDHVVLNIFEQKEFDKIAEKEISSLESGLSRMAKTGFIPFYDPETPVTEDHDPSITTVFCNFWPCPIKIDGRVYPHTEAAQNADKTDDPAVKNHFTAVSGKEAWQLGRDIKMSPQRLSEWNSTRKFSRMLQVVRKKADNPYFRRLLLATGKAYLVEHSPWVFYPSTRSWGPRDSIWADGHTGTGEGGEINSPKVKKVTFNDPDYPGRTVTLERVNALGQILMIVRNEKNGLMNAPIPPRNTACKAFHAEMLSTSKRSQVEN